MLTYGWGLTSLCFFVWVTKCNVFHMDLKGPAWATIATERGLSLQEYMGFHISLKTLEWGSPHVGLYIRSLSGSTSNQFDWKRSENYATQVFREQTMHVLKHLSLKVTMKPLKSFTAKSINLRSLKKIALCWEKEYISHFALKLQATCSIRNPLLKMHLMIILPRG